MFTSTEKVYEPTNHIACSAVNSIRAFIATNTAELNNKEVFILPSIFWRQQISWSYCATSLTQFE